MDKINEKIKAARIKMGATQEEVASALGIPVEQVDDFENGKRENMMSIEQILKFVGFENGAPDLADFPEEPDIDYDKLSELGKIMLKDAANTLEKLE